MKISFDNFAQNESSIKNTKSNAADPLSTTKRIGSSYDILPSLEDNKSYEGSKKSLNEFRDSLKGIDVELNQDAMAVMSSCMSDEDFGKMLKDGINPSEMNVKDAVTILDRIKLTLAKSGTNVEGFTDTLDKETIKEITGLEGIASEAKERDITLTDETCKEISEAVSMVKDISTMTEGMKKFFVSENKDLTIDNLYLAKHSASEITKSQGSEYFGVEAKGYLVKKGAESENLEAEVSALLENTNIEASKENVLAGVWLVENDIAVNEENIEKVKDIENISLPLSDNVLSKAVAIAVSEGKPVKEANLTKSESVYEEAVRISEEIEKVIDTPFVKATRILEETRLKMTAEANLLLIKSNYHIDTKDLEKYVDRLKELENNETYKEVREIVVTEEAVKTVMELPAAVIAPIAPRIETISLNEVIDEGLKVKTRLDSAAIAYEKVFTEVRRDLGDSIKKAFRNVPQILSELGMDDSAENQRAVRILGYNSMEINKESIEKIKEADSKLLNALNRITPKDTLTLIREGKSPIHMSVEELNEYLDSKKDPEKEEIEKYSKFLYKLERDGDITKEERADYIEVYRFINKIEKTEGAAVGAVLNAGQDFTLGNLKTAMKTAKHRGMNVTVGEVYETLTSGEKDFLEKDWIATRASQLREALSTPEEIVTELINNNIPVSAENLEATLLLRKNRGEAFKTASEASKAKAKEKLLKVSDTFDENETTQSEYDEMITESKAAVYEECMSKESYVDVRALQLVHMELSVARSFASAENYEVPMEIGGQVTSVNVRLVHNSKEDPNVVISLKTDELGRISARLTKEKGEITGYISCNLKESVMRMQEVADRLGTKVSVVWSQNSDSDLTLSRIPMKDNDSTDTKELYDTAKRFLAALKG